jgi:biopolymer transport protein ExbB/TolQ
MTKELRTSLLRTAAGLFVAGPTAIGYTLGWYGTSTDQLVLQGIVFLCGLALLVQGVTGLLTERRS